jgi:NAD(P)-dependent dehydrogenase (short-subunit alcohol dehydrogenase family)
MGPDRGVGLKMTVSEGTVIVTGATRGIGRATVEAILARGGKVVAIARDEGALRALEASAAARIRAVAVDLEDVARVPEAAQRAIDAFGSVDGLVNCAGIARYEPVGSIALDSIEAQLRVNVVAPLLLSQAVAKHLRGRGGAIVNVSSTLSEHVAQSTVVYAATKAALNTLTKGLALELASAGVRVNAVLPGGVETDMLRTPRLRPGESLTAGELDRRVESQLARLAALHPLGRLGTPEEVAAVIISVLDQTWQTGSLVTIDGGLSVA